MIKRFQIYFDCLRHVFNWFFFLILNWTLLWFDSFRLLTALTFKNSILTIIWRHFWAKLALIKTWRPTVVFPSDCANGPLIRRLPHRYSFGSFSDKTLFFLIKRSLPYSLSTLNSRYFWSYIILFEKLTYWLLKFFNTVLFLQSCLLPKPRTITFDLCLPTFLYIFGYFTRDVFDYLDWAHFCFVVVVDWNVWNQ